jgi:hypothetical protein
MSEGQGEADEAKLRIAADYQRVFGTPEGQRVLGHMLKTIFRTEDRAWSRPADWALYMCALHDAANDLCAILNIDFEQRKPLVAQRPHRFTQRANT